MKLLTILGARPQFIKAAAVSRAIKMQGDFEEVIVHTGQHFDRNMSEIFFEEMQIPRPKYNLGIKSLSHGAMTGRMLEAIEQIVQAEKPAFTMVYGDTNSTLAGALAVKKLHKQLVHVEAGLRSFNMNMPEEINRILTDRISDILYCPTENACSNLRKEGYDNFPCEVVLSGDVMQDAAMFYRGKSNDYSSIVESLNLVPGHYILCTFHRAENTDNINNLTEIVMSLNALQKQYMSVIVPMHPRTNSIIKKHNILINFTIIDPVGYFDMLQLIDHSKLVCTDSGGLQKEAYFFDKYCVTLRKDTEWTELVNGKYNFLVGTNQESVVNTVASLLESPFPDKVEFYGGGKAGQVICQHLTKYLASK